MASAFVLVAEKLEMLLTPVMREARALGVESGGRMDAAKTNPSNATSTETPHRVFFVFIDRTFDVCADA